MAKKFRGKGGGSENGKTKGKGKEKGKGRGKGRGKANGNQTSRNRYNDLNKTLYQTNDSEGSLPKAHRHYKMSLSKEAWLTSHHGGISNNKLREMPIVFIKSTEVYDPSKLDWDPINKRLKKIEGEEGEGGVEGVGGRDIDMQLDEPLDKQYTDDVERAETATSEKDIFSSEDDDYDIEAGDDEKSDPSSLVGWSGMGVSVGIGPGIGNSTEDINAGSGSGSGSSSNLGLGLHNNNSHPVNSSTSQFKNTPRSSLYRMTSTEQIDSHEFSLDTAGIADDEEEEGEDLSSIYDKDNDDNDDGNHSSDVEYEQLIGLRRLALRDLDIGGSIEDELSQDADSSSNNEEDEGDFDEEDEYDEYDEYEYEYDDSDDDKLNVDEDHENYENHKVDILNSDDESDLDDTYDEPLPPGPILRILKTQYSANGKEFIVEWTHEFESIRDSNHIDEDELFELYQDFGYTNEKIFAKIRNLGGVLTEDEGDDDEDFNDSINNNNLYFQDTNGDDYISSNDELDSIIARLVQDDETPRKKKNQESILESFANTNLLTTNNTSRKGKMPDFQVSDDELKSYLELQWVKSRQAKKLKKEQREKLRKEGGLKKQKVSTDVINLQHIYVDKITVQEVFQELKDFTKNGTIATTLRFPPVDNNARFIIKRMCEAFKLSPATRGDGLNKSVLATRTSSTSGFFNEQIISQFLNRRKIFPRTDNRVQERSRNKKRRERKLKDRSTGGGGGIVHHKEGDIVGGTADELGIDNIGRVMLEKMGWKVGMGLGSTTLGIIEPISAKVKKTKWGIGMEMSGKGGDGDGGSMVYK